MVNGHTNGRYLDERSYDPFWERVEALGVPIYLHPRDPFDAPHMFAGHRELLGATWSWTVETATHALRLVFGGVFDRHPKARLILGHMGETLPYLLWRLDSRSRARAEGEEAAGQAPSQIIRDNILITTSGVCSHAALACALAALGEDSVMFSVDYPFEDCAVAAKFIDSAPLSEVARAKVCHGTARRLLGCSGERSRDCRRRHRGDAHSRRRRRRRPFQAAARKQEPGAEGPLAAGRRSRRVASLRRPRPRARRRTAPRPTKAVA